MEKKAYLKIFTFAIFAFTFLLITPHVADAANLYFSPSSGSYAAGAALSVSVYVSSADQAMNAASGMISFSQDKLEVASLSKTGSIFSLWVQEPVFSNSAGTVDFEGIVLNPGFTGANGKIITINFKVKATGAALLNFSSGSALANDGKGTDILGSLGNAQFSLGGAAPGASEAIIRSETAGTPSAPQISSPTHPDPNKWYVLSDAKFMWSAPEGVTGVRLLVGRIPAAIPTVTYIPPISSKEVVDLADGVWYFSARMQNKNGWGAVSHFRFQIDTEKPSRFEITEIPRKDLTEPKAKFIFDAKDDTSGIDHYEIQFDNGNSEISKDDGSHRYETPAVGPGKHNLIAKAIDKAGNSLASSVEFTVEALNAPIITDYPKELQRGETLIVHGSTYPNSKANIRLQRQGDEPKSFNVQSDEAGKFTFTADEKLNNGTYQLWVGVVDARGAKSLFTEKITITIAGTAIVRIGRWLASFPAKALSLAALIAALLLVLWYGWHKFSLLQKRIRKEVREAESVLHRAFDTLKEHIREQIKLLEKTRSRRQLTEEEEKIIKHLKRDIDEAEKFVKKEIEDIEKAVKK